MMCKYCEEPEDKQNKPGLICEKCASFVHLTCLKRPGTPGDFSCDVFFDFTCEGCTPENKEMFVRNKFPWVNVLTLTLHHLSVHSYGISNHGFFHYKTHICCFIDRNWYLLFGMTCKQKKNWVGTIAGVLSVYNTLLFQSGSLVLGETGWWKLQHNFSPAVAAHIMQELTKHKPKGRLKMKSQMALDKMLFISKVSAMGYQDLINSEKEPRALEPASKRRRVDSDESSVSGEQLDAECKTEICEESILDESFHQEGYSDVVLYPTYNDTTNASYILPSDSSSIHSYQPNTVFYDSDSRSGSPNHQQPEEDQKPDIKTLPPEKKTMEEKEKVIEKRDSLFSSQLNSTDLPWIEKTEESSKDLVEMTPYEEIQLLKQVEGLMPKVKDPNKRAYLQRFRAKLALRRLKRHKHLPIFDLDKTVKLLSGCATEDPRDVMNVERVLDRFQRSYLLDNLSGTIAGTCVGAVVVPAGCARALRSPHSGASLPPYIRRDYHSTPTWLRVTEELMRRTHRHISDYAAAARAPVDYCYVRPQHIPAVNSLLAQFFWPGIDMSEALEYPEFSCVVMYRKLVVGCAFLVPDVGPHEAYVSFILTRPEWRNAGIATFMLYHLLQTCTGKDVTLHVSPTNPAIFLYQKFGFKVEEFIQDFYEKYYDIDYKGCRHALFLRLVR